MSKEYIEELCHAFEMVNLKIEKSKFHKIVRQPGPERLLFLQRCLSELCRKGQGHFAFIDANSLEKQKQLEEEIVKHMAAYGICQERRIVMGNGSVTDNLLFWNKLLLVIQSSQSARNKDSRSDWSKSLSFMTELLQHPHLEKVLEPQKGQMNLNNTTDFIEEEMLQAKSCDNQNDYSMEQSVSPTFQKQEDNCNNLCQRLKENLLILHERLEEFKDASENFPRMETANLSGMGEAIEEQCSQLERIQNFYNSAEKIESAIDFLTSIEPPNVTATDSENLLFNNSSPDLLNGTL